MCLRHFSASASGGTFAELLPKSCWLICTLHDIGVTCFTCSMWVWTLQHRRDSFRWKMWVALFPRLPDWCYRDIIIIICRRPVTNAVAFWADVKNFTINRWPVNVLSCCWDAFVFCILPKWGRAATRLQANWALKRPIVYPACFYLTKWKLNLTLMYLHCSVLI